MKKLEYKKSSRSTTFTEVKFKTNFIELYNVHLDGCPRQITSELTCRPNVVGQVYSGPNNATFDYGLQPFTGKFPM